MKKIIYILSIIAAVMTIYSCKGPEGEAGPRGLTGDTGATGENGIDGTDGTDGIDGVGNYEASNGYIALAFEGTWQGTVPFEDSVVCEITKKEQLYDFSSADYGSSDTSFQIIRYPANRTKSLGQEISLYFWVDDNEIYIDDLEFTLSFPTAGDDFLLYDEDYIVDYITPEDISGYSYDPETGSITLKIEVEIPADANSTKRDLTMRLYLNATVYQLMPGVIIF